MALSFEAVVNLLSTIVNDFLSSSSIFEIELFLAKAMVPGRFYRNYPKACISATFVSDVKDFTHTENSTHKLQRKESVLELFCAKVSISNAELDKSKNKNNWRWNRMSYF